MVSFSLLLPIFPDFQILSIYVLSFSALPSQAISKGLEFHLLTTLSPSSSPAFPLTVTVFLTYSPDCASTAQISTASQNPQDEVHSLCFNVADLSPPDPCLFAPTLCLAIVYLLRKYLLNHECSLGCVLCLHAVPASWNGFLNMVCPVAPGWLLL